MTRLRFAIATAAVLAVGAATVAADEWKTVTLRGEAGFTISIPSAAVNKVDEKSPDDLLFIAVEATLHGGLVCIAQRLDYPQGVTREAFAATLATQRREAFCQNAQAAAGTLAIAGSHSFKRDGLQGAVCTASFTDSAAKLPGRVESQMIVAAASGIYSLDCTVEDEDQEMAQYEWASLWGEKVRHIQESFRLPTAR